MSRLAVAAAVLASAAAAAACSKSEGKSQPAPPSTNTPVVPPGVGPVAGEAAQKKPAAPAPANDSMFRLKPDEGTLTIEVPADAKAGAETTAKVIVTPTSSYKINFEYPTKLTLAATPNVTIPKPELKAGGPSQAKGDAEKFEEKQLVFAVKLTPTAPGSHTVTGAFKFAVCDLDQCLNKRETIAIQVAAK